VGTFRGLSLGLAPLGALAGGFAAAAVGPRPIMFVLAAGTLAPILVMALSPLPRVRKFPSPADAG
jgi:hypothetical protein